MNPKTILTAAAITTLLAAAAPAAAQAGTNEVRNCTPVAGTTKLQVNKYTTTCKLGRAAADRIFYDSFPYPTVKIQGVRMTVTSTFSSGRSVYYFSNPSGKEISVTMKGLGGGRRGG
jgi:hypothetical protein